MKGMGSKKYELTGYEAFGEELHNIIRGAFIENIKASTTELNMKRVMYYLLGLGDFARSFGKGIGINSIIEYKILYDCEQCEPNPALKKVSVKTHGRKEAIEYINKSDEELVVLTKAEICIEANALSFFMAAVTQNKLDAQQLSDYVNRNILFLLKIGADPFDIVSYGTKNIDIWQPKTKRIRDGHELKVRGLFKILSSLEHENIAKELIEALSLVIKDAKNIFDCIPVEDLYEFIASDRKLKCTHIKMIFADLNPDSIERLESYIETRLPYALDEKFKETGYSEDEIRKLILEARTQPETGVDLAKVEPTNCIAI